MNFFKNTLFLMNIETKKNKVRKEGKVSVCNLPFWGRVEVVNPLCNHWAVRRSSEGVLTIFKVILEFALE